jgi:hypothetical protein
VRIFGWIRSKFTRRDEPAYPEQEDLGLRALEALSSGDVIDDPEVVNLLLSGPLRIDNDGTIHPWEE